MKFLAVLAAVAIVAASPTSAADLDFVGFFLGRTHGENEVKVALRKPVRQVTNSIGKKAANGDLILIDTIKEEGRPVKTRRWVMRAAGANRFTGSMSDAVTPVEVRVQGRTATLQYKVKGGISVNQTLTIRDSNTVTNHVAAKKLGVRLGRLEGTIRKLD
ncbi:MAG: DUF3833 family protein [Pseudomonadota bacterium]|nr:DUF3833 family protein [Pseudomonadota bacterium]